MCFSSVALILSSAFSSADTCPANVQATIIGDPEILDPIYQPPAPDENDILHRYRFLPPNAGPYNKYPTVLMFPPDVYKLEYGEFGVQSERIATRDLQYAGFLVFQVNHRLAPPGTLDGQNTSGRAPAQTDDAKRQILAALADPQCNGSIYLVGGSGGGTLALWCALDSATGAVPGWNNTARQKIKGVVSMSGVADLNNWDHPGIPNADYESFEKAVDNYVGLIWPDHTPGPLLAASPVNLITNGATSSPPVRLYASTLDSVSYVQANEMETALAGIGVTAAKTIFPGSDHAYKNWHKIDPSTGNCVSSDVIAFFQNHP